MKEAIILALVVFVFYTVVLVYMNIANKKKAKEGKEARKVQFNAELFGIAFIPTNLIILVIADEFYKFIILYAYFLSIIYIAHKLHIKHLNKERNH
ncbi:hypothetical protein [Amphibacillus xylanus]|uniref:Uncharacterized protein n=1 Tax=Amphibacillus xylanus (strain ATCC 51415 / DSM 6626 / JCM 7361 / LMG 17667 / NBRC 15112 / Ep01) TaxID=698758 RepID=K0J191_AMPXN|nr:hypothetical protein [Amphibacillus xylanus]BAM46892.1 hypothetical protein AXY_07600 [Amphibacillus xylanus NBRC 15112]